MALKLSGTPPMVHGMLADPMDAMRDENSDTARSNALMHAWASDTQAVRPGPRKTFSTGAVVQAGVVLYDINGHQGFSLAKLAASLRLTTNALYRYVSSREELEALIRDAALGQPDLEDKGDWKDRVRAWAHALVRRYSQHAWLAQLPVRIPFTPNAVAWLDALLLDLQAAGFDRQTQLCAAAFLDSHVRACAITASDQKQARGLALPDEFERLLNERGLHAVADLVGQGEYVEVEIDASQMLAFGLETFLAGLEVRAGATTA
ncbi:TetR/AcrR family transcriptional regulator C-terminal domain-containing protein [Sphingomonas sp. QA11]|uniref:TetR/AcrR family transcriptional regulator n=1 Tax=Sphingomonas sp. QA11 TaxID=2950605 RepID=UPI00234AFEE3|nr:TetR/AcrR family transcriptional regulator C-terminal domain-containing protein [Sphingomonas sp. QA11]WCM27385.1 TetR/AcrR family transcriptional regulator C-terminal domain-containing protein [Sphingomonas sp. QA11]